MFHTLHHLHCLVQVPQRELSSIQEVGVVVTIMVIKVIGGGAWVPNEEVQISDVRDVRAESEQTTESRDGASFIHSAMAFTKSSLDDGRIYLTLHDD